jgi:hypothetical protein
MPRKTEDSETQAASADETGRRYRSIAEIRRDFFPDAPANLFELGPSHLRQEVTPRLTAEPGDE